MDLEYIGCHCSDLTCKQKDFLPLFCKYCSKVFCKDHYKPEKHDCQSFWNGSKRAIVCPLCDVTLNYIEGQIDPNDLFTQHFNRDCKREIKNDKKKCNVKNCKTVLGPLNSFYCKNCKNTFCLKHRFCETHKNYIVKEFDRKNQQVEKQFRAMYQVNQENNKNSKQQTIQQLSDQQASQQQQQYQQQQSQLPKKMTDYSNEEREQYNKLLQNLIFCQICGESFNSNLELENHHKLVHAA